MARFLLLMVLFACALTTSAESPGNKEPVAKKGGKTTQQQEPAKLDTSSLERAIREAAKEAREKPDAHADEKLDIDRQLKEYTGHLAEYTSSLSSYTFWLVVATGVLGIIAVFQYRVGRDAADAFPRIERAYVFLDSAKGRTGARDDWREGGHVNMVRNIWVDFTIKNHGRTPAILIEVVTDVRLCRSLSEAANPAHRSEVLVAGRLIAAGESGPDDILDTTVDHEALKAVEARPRVKDVRLVFFGKIRYFDVMRVERVTEFWRVFDYETDSFRHPADGEGNRWT